MKRLGVVFLAFIFVVSCGGGGGGGGGGGSTPPPNPAPSVNLSASPSEQLVNSNVTLTWSSSNATSCSASGDWSGTKDISGSEDVPIGKVGSNTYSLACSGAGGNRSDAVIVVGYRNTDGIVVDGYISGADVFIDENDNFINDNSEYSTTSDNEGKFTIRYANGNLVSLGGTDLDSQTLLDNLLITHKLTGHSEFKAVTPVTSIEAFMEVGANINNALGIDSAIDISVTDPVANKGDGGIYDFLYEKGNQLTVLAYALQNITNDLNTTSETTEDYFKAIAEEIETEFNETSIKVDIETETFINKAFENVITAKSITIDETAKANTVKALSGVLPIVEVKASDDLTTSVIRFAVSTLQEDIKAVANGTASAEKVASYTSDVIDYIAQDQNISSNDITPDISAIDDSITTAEDTPVNVQVLANDSYITTAPISISATNGDNGKVEVAESSPEQITYSPDTDYFGSDTFSYTITQGDKVSSADVSVNISSVNDVPSLDIASTLQVVENETFVTTISISDADEDELTLTLGGTDAESFNLSDEYVLSFKEAPDYEVKSSYSIELSLTDNIETVNKTITINILDVDELSTANDCNYIVNDASTGEFRYCWEEAQSTSGSEYSANVVEPLTITFADESIEIPAISYAEKLYVEYGIVLESSGGDWTNDQAYAIYQTLKKIPQNVRNEANDRRVFSKWALTDLQIQDDISFDKDATNIEVTIESSVFENANPRIATVDGKKGIYFSNKLHNALVRYITNSGNDTSAVNKILVERYGVTTSIDDYVALTGEQATRFQDFQAEELVAIIAMFEEMPSGYHKIEGLDYLVRRINGADNPYYPEAPAIAWDGSGYIEFMEKAFNTFSIDYLHRLILHEKAHFLWAKIFDDVLKNDWIELGGWYECTEKESGWCTTKQTEFVSAYAHLKNPNEDMAESLSYFIVNPDALKSRSLAKYEFVRDRIMQGNIYISQIQENLTFKVYNLYPDYVFPGKVKKLFVSVDGSPTEDKTVTVEIKLHALDNILEGAAWARMRIFSTADTYFDLYLYPQNGQNLDTTLRGTFTLSKYAKSGFWKTSQLVLSDEVGNLRMEGANDFGWRMYVNNPNEDLDKPLYIANSMTLTKSLTTIENQEVDVITAIWDIDEAFPRENQGCYGALNDENPSTYSLQKYSPGTYSGNYEAGKCLLEYIMPSYMPSGTYRLNYIKMIDEAGNESRNYFATPSGVDTGDNFAGDQLDELAKEVVLETSNPDITAPELDLNNISINATPTNPDNPNGETIVKFTFRVKDDISGYKLGYYTFRDPQGLTSAYYHYPERRSEIFPTAEDLDWYEYTSTVILPAGSAPGTWGVVELTLRDRALNFKTYNFTEIISFQTE
jgi:hypothetical protein